jgi:thioredoxin 1
MGSAVNVTDQNFETEVLKSDTPVLVDFWAEWCGPCKAISPIIEELAGEYDGKVKVAKMNVDNNANTPATYGVRSIPTLILFKSGEIVETIVGAQPKSILTEKLDQSLA